MRPYFGVAALAEPNGLVTALRFYSVSQGAEELPWRRR